VPGDRSAVDAERFGGLAALEYRRVV